MKIAVLGSGSWGLGLAQILDDNGHEAVIYGNDEAQINEINYKHTNKKYLPDVIFSEKIVATTSIEEAVTGAGMVVFVVPTMAIRTVAKAAASFLDDDAIIVHASKGLEQGTHKRISTILAEELPSKFHEQIVVLSGPSHAEEVAMRDLTSITSASTNNDAAKTVQDIFSNKYFRVYTNSDIIGVEIGAAVKNVIAVCAGAAYGLGLGDNAKAALMTRGLAEISRLGVAFGANPMTFLGLSGLGDLIVTCTSVHSRNWKVGKLLGEGLTLDEAVEKTQMIAEGVYTTKAAKELSEKLHVDMPITHALYAVLYEGAQIKEVVSALMSRDSKPENDYEQM
ncbi:MAG: NAD(P)H-dependent glycerol-3-phosphate dehydrogenase [Lactobacillales bacterium]|jgi:glycerol-3-phosphate dehydrogenase (NAD(P)+)|nr:NAD(P)H-dependent glycerol-3-phosphate dehydrogenase [Lactobacillales bacterium]